MKASIKSLIVVTTLMACIQTYAQTTVPKLTDRSRNGLMAYFHTIIKNKQILVGQQCSETPDAQLEYKKQFQRLYDSTGKYPALIGLEYGFFDNMKLDIVNQVATDHWKQGGLVTVSWHADNPFTKGYNVRWNSEMNKDSIHFERLLKKAPVSTERSYYRDELSRVAFGLKQLKQAGVQILWRPFHEMNGNWFWWGPDNPRNPSNINSYQALWKDMYETFTKDFGLDNLIWVYAPFSSDGSVMPSVNAYYPGDQYVDIVAVDVYPVTPNFDDYNELKKLGKLVANGEIGPTKESYGHFDQMAVIKVLSGKASYFLQWSSWWKANVNIVDNLNYNK